MTVAVVPDTVDSEARLKLAWDVALPTATFILGVEASSRAASDIVDGLLVAAIQSANVSRISSYPDLQLAYATLADAPPDELRRPVSVSAIANSLRMPFETARRRVQRLVRLGALQITPKGVLVAHAALTRPEFLSNVFLRHEQLRTFHLSMRRLGVLPAEPPGPPPQWTAPPLRLTNRLIWEYMLRVADDLGATVGDATNGFILLSMIRQNTEGFGPSELAAWAGDPRALGQPVRNRRLAEGLNLSAETLRRYVIALERQGLCVRGPRGLVAVAPPGARSILDRLVLDNLVNVQRLFGRLRQFGVLSMWDAPTAAATGP